MGFQSISDLLKGTFGLEYLYNVLPLDVVSDTLGVLSGQRRNLKPLRQFFGEEIQAWRTLFPPGTEPYVFSELRRLLLDRVAVSRTRQGEPNTLAPLSLAFIGDPADKKVANAFRGMGSFGAKLFTASAREKLLRVVGTWADQPLARMAETVLRHAEQVAAGTSGKLEPAAAETAPAPDLDVRWAAAQEDFDALLEAWERAPFGPEQQLDQLRALLCFHMTLHLLRVAAEPLEHLGDRGTQTFFVCDASQVVGSAIARAATQSFSTWTSRLHEVNFALCLNSARSLRQQNGQAWDKLFEELAAGQGLREAVADTVARWALPKDRPRRNLLEADFVTRLTEKLEILCPDSPEVDPVQLVGEAMVETYQRSSRILEKVFECLRSLGDGAGLIGPKGTHHRKRFLLRADLLEALATVHCVRCEGTGVDAHDPLSVGTFLRECFRRYGIVVDPARPEVVEAIDKMQVDPRIVSQLPDASVGAENVRELEDRLIELRLARRYSDASVCLDDSALAPREARS